MSSPDLASFEETYARHVGLVQAGDVAGMLDDMAPGAAPAVFEGVVVPRGAVLGAEIRAVRVEGARGTGECVYTLADGRIGLRSGWVHDGTAWKADALENFAV